MKKFLTVLLVIAVMFTFSFGSALAAVDKTPITDAQTAAYAAIEKAGETILNKYVFKDGFLAAEYFSDPVAQTDVTVENSHVSEAVVKAAVADAVTTAKETVQATVTSEYAGATTAGEVATAVVAVQDAAADAISTLTSGTDLTSLSSSLIAEQKKLDKAAAKAEWEAFDTSVYSDDTDEYVVAPTDVFGGTYTASTVSGISANASAKKFVGELIKTQLAVVNGASATLAQIATAEKTMEDIIFGHKITADEDYYIAPLPTKAALEADTTVEAAKAYAISKMEAALAAKIVDLKEIVNGLVDAENKLAKPDADKLAAYSAFLAGVDAQAAAAKEVYAAQLNAQETVNAVYTKDVSNAVDGGQLKTILDAIAGYSASYSSTDKDYTCSDLEALVDVTEDIDELEAYAQVLASLVDREGVAMYDAAAIAAALEAAKEDIYTGAKNLTQAQAMVNAAANVADKLIPQKSTFIKNIEGTGAALTLGTKSYAVWNAATAYEEAQLDAYKAVVADTKAAILAAESYEAIVDAYVAGYKAYDEIITIAEHTADWATSPTGALRAEYTKNYKTDYDAYVTYVEAKLDATKNSYVLAAWDDAKVAAAAIVKEAYTKAELPAQIAAAKAYLDSVKSNAEIDALNKEVSGLISALPSNVALTDRAQIVAAKEAYDDYNEIPGATTILNDTILTNCLSALQGLEEDAMDAAVKAIGTVTVDDAAAIAALRADYDAYEDLYGSAYTTVGIAALESALSTAQVRDVALKCAALSVNPVTDAEKQAVKDAQAAFDALTIHQQADVIAYGGGVYYDKLSQAAAAVAEEEKFDDVDAKAYLQDLSLKARSVKTAKGNVKVTAVADVDVLLENGYTVEYKFYRSTKSNKGFKGVKDFSEDTTYTNTKGTKGTKYFYKVVVQAVDAEGNVVAKTPLKHCLYASRTWTK